MSTIDITELKKFLSDLSGVILLFDDHKPAIRTPPPLNQKRIEKMDDKDLLALTVSHSMSMSGSASDDSINYISTDMTESKGLEPAEFNEILKHFYPDIKLKDYLDLKELLLKFKEEEEHGYYGSFTMKIHSTVNLAEIFQFLKENDRLTLVIGPNVEVALTNKEKGKSKLVKKYASKKKKNKP